ncbi:MAG: Ni/Fe-hydrogenase, b-type cytochrome subunit [Rhodocyclaceae bacterium]|nr:Ni/Fe-hydrogenase, b-type cytochrome subunit [Rhodocyclaceae bacterium]
MLAEQDLLEAKQHGRDVRAIYVYEAPLRLWHWINAICITVLAVTGYFIGQPLPTVPGEASDNFVLGYIRFAHFAAAYLFAVGLLGRIYWALVGNHHARQVFSLPITNARWWSEVFFELRWYMFLEKEPNKYVGHNPLAQLMMFFFFTLLSIGMLFTGFALYSEGAGLGSWQDTLFGWVIPALGGSMQAHSIHRLGMWIMVVFVMVHIYAAIREDIMSRQSLLSTMVSGWRMFKD